jgi:SpoIID/LytB domain protein
MMVRRYATGSGSVHQLRCRLVLAITSSGETLHLTPRLGRLAGLTVCLVLAAPLAPAHADDPYPVPDTATITVVGDGSGHGKGLSQYGAYGAARQGRSAQQILDFYYPGTRTGHAGGSVKVLISADHDRDLVVDARPGLTLRKVSSGRTWRLTHAGATRWRIQRSSSGADVVSYRTGAWHQSRVLSGDVEIAAGGDPVALRTPAGRTAYRGALRSTTHDGRRVTVNVLPMEAYLRGVVPAEVAAASWPQQAMRAQAVAARTYATYERQHGGNSAYDLCDTALCQAYGGASAEYPTSDTAVARTAGRILTYQGKTAFAQYSASNGGWTVDGGKPYLVAEKDPYEGTSPDYYGWTQRISAHAIEKAYNIENLSSIAIETRDGHGRRGGRVETVRLESTTGWSGTVTGDSFRSHFGLRSTLFEITQVQ